MTKRVLSLLLVLVMALSLSVPAFADGEDVLAAGELAADAPAPIADWVAKDAVGLKAAIANKQSPITIIADIPDLSSVDVGYALVLNLGSFQIKGDITVKKGGSLTVNATKNSQGVLGGIDGDVIVGQTGTTTQANLTVNSGYITGGSDSADGVKVVNGNVSVPAGSTANIYTISSDMSAVGGSTITIAGGTIGNAVVPANGPVLSNGKREVTVAISGGTFVAAKGTATISNGGSHYITGGTFIPGILASDASDGAAMDVALNGTYATVETSKGDYTVVGKAAVEAEAKELASGNVISVQQGDAAFTGVPAGVTVLNEGDGTVTVDSVEIDDSGVKYVARIGSKSYKSLDEAVDHAVNGDTITLLTNVSEEDAIALTKNLTLDLNGKVLTTASGKSVTFGNSTTSVLADVPTITVTGGGNIRGNEAIILNTGTLILDDVNVEPDIASGTGVLTAYVGNNLTVSADSIVTNIGATGKKFDAVVGTVTIDGTVNGTVNIKGEEAEVIVNAGAVIKGATTIGAVKGTDYITVTISGGEFGGAVTINAEEHAPVAITGGTFKDETAPLTLNGPTHVVSGGIYNTSKDGAFAATNVKIGSGAAKITDSKTKNAYKYSEWTFVGDAAVAEGLANIAKGSLDVTAGTVTLASIGNDITAQTTKPGQYLKVGNVTIGTADSKMTSGSGTVSGEKINELNAQIATAQRAQLSGKLSDKELRDLVTAYNGAIAAQPTADAVQKSIEALKKALVGYEDEEVPAAPAGGTGWVQNASGEYYYYLNGKMVQNQWVESGRALWYYMNPDGTLAHGGFTLVPTCRGINKDGKDAGTFAAGYFYLRHNNYNGCIGQARHGSVAIEASTVASVPAKGTGVFETKHNGHYGACVSINGKAVKNYTELPA